MHLSDIIGEGVCLPSPAGEHGQCEGGGPGAVPPLGPTVLGSISVG